MSEIKETKRCPYCGEEIKAVAKKCRHCGEWLDKVPETKNEPEIQSESVSMPKAEPEKQTQIETKTQIQSQTQVETKNNNAPVKKFSTIDKVLIAFLSFLGCCIIALYVFGVIYNINNKETSSTQVETEDYNNAEQEEENYDKLYKDLLKTEAEYYKDISYKSIQYNVNSDTDLLYSEAYRKLNQLEDDLKSYFSEGHSKDKNSRLLLLYIINLHISAPGVYSRGELPEDTFLFNPPEEGYGGGTLKLVHPKVPSIKYAYSGEGMFNALINYKYIYDSYSEYLSEDMNEYLRIKSLEEEGLSENSGYFSEGGMNADSYTLVKWVKYWEDFIRKYPDSMMVSRAKINIIRYSFDMIWSPYSTFDEISGKLKPDVKKSYEYALEILDKNSNEYHRIKKCYDILKKNQYAFNDEFRDNCGGGIPYDETY